MELKSLADVELRDATFPLSRSAPSNFLPVLRTPVILRELFNLGVLDRDLSKVLVAGGRVVGCCLVERGATGGYVSGLGTDALSQQRGGARVLLEAVVAAAHKAGLAQLTMEVSEAEAGPTGALQALGFVPVRTRHRLALQGPPDRSLLPESLTEDPTSERRIAAVSVPLALDFLLAHGPKHPGAAVHPAVLAKLAGRLSAAAYQIDGRTVAAVVADKERKLVVGLGGDAAYLAPLAVFAAARFLSAHVDSIAEDDPALAALEAAGFVRIAVRQELSLSLPVAAS